MKKFFSNFLKRTKALYLSVTTFCLLTYTQFSLAAGTDLLKDSNDTVLATAGSDSTLVRWLYIIEVLAGLSFYIKTRNPACFAGIIFAVVFTAVGFGIAEG